MTKPKWGSKRQCHKCGARFYDLNRAEVACPKCGTPYDPRALLKSRRQRLARTEEKVVPLVPIEFPVEVETEEAKPADAGAPEGEESADEELIEDTSELGKDEDDVAEVMDNVDEEER